MDIFSAREVAITIWIAILFLFMLKSDAAAKAFLRIIKSLADLKLIIILEALAVYLMLVCYTLSQFMTWGLPQMKASIFWYLFVGIALLFRAVQAKEDYNPVRSWITNTFTFLIVVEFLTSTYTFPLLAELLFVPFVAIVAMMVVVAERNPDQKQVVSFLNWVMVLAGFAMIAYAARQLLGDTGSLDIANMAESFLLPILLSLLTIPFFYGLFIYVSYENAFIRFQWAFPDEELRAQAKRQGIKSFGLRTKALGRWTRLIQSDRPENMDEITASITEAKQVEQWEKNPPPVEEKAGWSPFMAKTFLKARDVKMFDYREYDGRWHADSQIIKTQEGFSQNHMIYMVEGSQLVADVLRLKLTLNDISTCDQGLALLKSYAQALLAVAAPDVDADEYIQEQIGGDGAEKHFDQFIIKTEKEVIEAGKLVIEEYEFRIEIA